MKQKKEKWMKVLFAITAFTSIAAVALICFFLFYNGLPAISKIGLSNFLFGTQWKPSDIPPSFGILPMILGSLYITAGSIIIGVPLGVLTAVFLVFFCPAALYKMIRPAINLLAGIPSIVYGFFGMVAIVPLIRQLFGGRGSSILAASILLGIMILPTIIKLAETSLRAVPPSYYEASVALGTSHARTVFSIVLPAAKSGVFAAMVLGIGRSIGETMAVIMVAGNQARIPTSLLKGVRTLTANIVLEMGYAADLHRESLIATGVVLFVFILLINLSFSLIKRRDAN